jgi:malonyl-CoA O-methyltransferase
VPLWHAYEAALDWLRYHRVADGGIAVSSTQHVSYPEVTGYLIPTLLESGERELAIGLARWLMTLQRGDGGFGGPTEPDESYPFDTGQVLRGFVAVAGVLPEVEHSLARAADSLINGGAVRGLVRPRPESRWMRQYGSQISESIHLYCLPPLLKAGELLGRPEYVEAAEKSLDYYLTRDERLLEFRFLTHYYGYVLEALVDLNRPDLARQGLEPILERQTPEGAIPGVPGAAWVCSPGALQMAIVGYKLGLCDFANRTFDYMLRLQLPNGGFLGSYGPGAAYARDGEVSWANKFFLDASHWRICSSFARQRERFSLAADALDPRTQPVLGAMGDLAGKRVLDVGCGRGKFLRLIQDHYATADLWGIDIADELLRDLPVGVNRRSASMLNLPFDDATFDVVLCVEALEHAVRIERAISEMCRVLRPGGRIVIVDKTLDHLGALPIEVWEQWFDSNDITSLLSEHGVSATATQLETSDGSSTYLRLWSGVRTGLAGAARRTSSFARYRSPALLDHYRRSRRTARARALANEGFASYGDRDLAAARSALVRAVLLDWQWLGNPGVRSIVVESLVGRRVMRYTRRVARCMKAAARRVDPPGD